MLELRVHGGVSNEITDSKNIGTIVQFHSTEISSRIFQSSPRCSNSFSIRKGSSRILFITHYEDKFYQKIRLLQVQ